MKTLVKIYVGTYHKYNSGSLAGAWLKLPMTEEGLRRALRKIAGAERDPEYMIQDTEISAGLDFRAIGESENIFALNKELSELRFEKDMLTRSPAVIAAIEEYKRVWKDDQHMIEYSADKISDVYQTEAGDLIEFDVPRIETHFCFAEDYNGAYCEELSKWARKMADEVSQTEAYFIEENMSGFEGMEKILAEGTARGRRVIWNNIGPSRLVEIVDRNGTWFMNWPDERAKLIPFTPADIAGISAMLKSEKEKFLLRLRRWWKRYGADGLRTWTYYSD